MVIDFLKTAISLKKIQRQGWIDKLSISNPESVADHTYSMAVIGMIISDLEDYDSEKILKMTLLHDLAESKVGDFVPGEISTDKKIKLENDAFLKIIENLSEPIKSQYQKIWQEYQKGDSKESMIVHQIDKLEMALQAKAYENEGYSKDKLVSFIESAEMGITDPKLKEILRKSLEEK
ncbi:MAG: HD domain-containing protein [Nitrosopumilus sp.]|nr:HD domain-containing protein [Nitrosopumilus sp.]